MKKMSHLQKGIAAAVLIAVVLTGGHSMVSSASTGNGAVEVRNTLPAAAGTELASNNEEAEVIEVTEAAKGSTSFMDLSVSENPEEENSAVILKEATVNALKKYFDVSFDVSEYEADVHHFKAFKDIEESYLVMFGTEENNYLLRQEDSIGPDGFPTAETVEKLRPEFTATFSGEKELTGLYVSYMHWDESEISLTIEEAKKVAKDFMEKNELIADGKIEFMSAKIISDRRTVLTYENGEDGAVNIAVDVFAGEVEHFEYMSRQRAIDISLPMKEGEGLG